MAVIAVIGAGAAGIFATLHLSQKHTVYLIDRNDIAGRKLAATGSGRGNLTNLHADADQYHGKPKRSTAEVLKQYPPEQLRRDLDNLGIFTYATDDGWVYPISNSAANVRDIFVSHLEQRNVKLLLNETVTGLDPDNFGVTLTFASQRPPLKADTVLLTIGGAAAPQLGADVSLYKAVIKSGHLVHPLRPALAPIITSEAPIKKLLGVRLDVTLSLFDHQARLGRNTGNLIFTEWGINGPAAMNLSHLIDDNPHRQFEVEIDFIPGQSKAMRTLFQQHANTSFPVQSVLKSCLPYKVVRFLLDKLNLPASIAVGQLTHQQSDKLFALLTAFCLPVTGTRDYTYAQLSAGGVDLSEVDPTSMQSLRLPQLYFAGEVLNVVGPCGGYNLHWAFATGKIAAEHLNQTD